MQLNPEDLGKQTSFQVTAFNQKDKYKLNDIANEYRLRDAFNLAYDGVIADLTSKHFKKSVKYRVSGIPVTHWIRMGREFYKNSDFINGLYSIIVSLMSQVKTTNYRRGDGHLNRIVVRMKFKEPILSREDEQSVEVTDELVYLVEKGFSMSILKAEFEWKQSVVKQEACNG